MKDDCRVRVLGKCRFESPVDSNHCVEEDARVLIDTVIGGQTPVVSDSFECAGPRRRIFFNPDKCRAAMVTCGGLCPGLNDVIRAATMVLWYRYGVRTILGLRYGYEGLIHSKGHTPIELTPELVEDIHQDGGTILGSSRGPQDVSAAVDFLAENGIDILFTIGGDGTQRGMLAIADEIQKRGLKTAVIGIPKTIDNDISYTQRTFGFETAVAMSQMPVTGAHMEAKGAMNGIGIVKLMGRESGFVAAYAALASSDVNLVLVPEVPFSMENVLRYLRRRFETKSHAVILTAEGAGQEHVPAHGCDASGNRKLGDVGLFLKNEISDHFKKHSLETHVKYIDPSYTIRSAPATPDDSVFCFQLAQNAVHAAMSGRTASIICLWNGRFVHVPAAKAVSHPKRIDPDSLFWQSVLDNTGQPLSLV